jgi:hypothetical protein
MLGVVAAAIRLVLGPLLTGIKALSGAWLAKLVGGVLVVGIGYAFRDSVLDGIAHVATLATEVLNGLGLELPSVADGLNALPPDMLIIMKRVGVDDCLAVIATAAAVRVVGSLFQWCRGLKILGGG